MLRRRPLLVLILIGLCTLRPPAALAASDACPPDPAYAAPRESLAALAKAIAAGGPVEVLAVGSATTFGADNGRSAFPAQMLEWLRLALPEIRFSLTVRGGRGMTASEMLVPLLTAVRGGRYTLVLWQTATVDAVRGVLPEELEQALVAGAEAVQRAGADLVLIDPQFSRFLRANVDLDPYEQALERVASVNGVALFHRFALMQFWAETGGIDLEAADVRDRQAVMLALRACVGHALASFVLNGMGR